MPQDTYYILTTPDSSPCPSARNLFPAWLAYRVSPGAGLLRLQNAHRLRGGLMVVSGSEGDLRPPYDPLCRAILRECALHGFRGLLLDLDRPSPACADLVIRLSRLLHGRGITLFLPECLAEHAPGSRVLIPSALSGGSLQQRLEEAVEKYGRDRTVLAVQRCAEEFSLPAPDGCGRPLSDSALEQMLRDLRPSVHLSSPLCARYFTLNRADEVHLVLYDDPDTLVLKLEAARAAGVTRFLLPWLEIRTAPERFFPPPEPSKNFYSKN